MEHRGISLEKKVASIKSALKLLEESLEKEQNYEKKSSFSPKRSRNTFSPQFNTTSSFKFQNSQKLDLASLYSYEKERNSLLEVRISHKDELLSEMTALQNELYLNIEGLQSKIASLQSDLIDLQRKNQELSSKIETHSDLLNLKDEKIWKEKEKHFPYFIEKNEGKVLSEELPAKEPEKRLIVSLEKKNQELLLEINCLKNHLQTINTNNAQTDLKEKLLRSEADLENLVKSHASEVSNLLNKINNLEFQLIKKLTEKNHKKIAQIQDQKLARYKKYYNEVLALLGLSDGQHQESLEKINGLLCRSLESPRFSEITRNLCDELGVQPGQIMNSVRELQENSKITQKLYEKLGQLMVQCSPKGKFNTLPSCRQVWEWVTRVLEDYMALRKEKLS